MVNLAPREGQNPEFHFVSLKMLAVIDVIIWRALYRTGDIELPVVDVVDEGDVILWMPVQAIADGVEGNGLEQLVDGGNNLKWEVSGLTIDSFRQNALVSTKYGLWGLKLKFIFQDTQIKTLSKSKWE